MLKALLRERFLPKATWMLASLNLRTHMLGPVIGSILVCKNMLSMGLMTDAGMLFQTMPLNESA